MADSSFDKFKIETGPINPGDITTTTVVDGTFIVHYSRSGNLLFNLYVENNVGQKMAVDGNTAASVNRIATLLGTTVNTAYSATQNINPAVTFFWNGSIWTNTGGSTLIAESILLN